jgi:DNA polymerase sigma
MTKLNNVWDFPNKLFQEYKRIINIEEGIQNLSTDLLNSFIYTNKLYDIQMNFFHSSIDFRTTFSEIFEKGGEMKRKYIGLIFENIIYLFFEIFQMIDKFDRTELINDLSKLLAKYKMIKVLNLIIAYINFIESLEKVIEFDYCGRSELEFENGDIKYTYILCSHYRHEDNNDNYHNIEISEIYNDYDFELNFYNSNQLKQNYLCSKVTNLIYEFNNSAFHIYQSNFNFDTLKIIQKTNRLKIKKTILKEEFVFHSLNLRDSLIFLEKDVIKHFKLTKRNTTAFVETYNKVKTFIYNDCQLFEDVEIFPFGSLTQFSYNCFSDLEITLIKKTSISDLIDLVESCLLKSNKFSNVDLRVTKRIKLLNFLDTNNLVKVEMMEDNYFGILNSELIRNYCLYDSRCAIMINIIKDWSKVKKINGNFNGFLSSYCYTIMVIFFLQKINPPVLPVFSCNKLTELKVNSEICYLNIDFDKKLRITNNHSISSLLLGFFLFYSCMFNEIDYCIDINSNQCIYRYNEITYLNESKIKKKALLKYCFLDPFDTSYNPGAYFIKNSSQDRIFSEEMKRAIQSILKNRSIFSSQEDQVEDEVADLFYQ